MAEKSRESIELDNADKSLPVPVSTPTTATHAKPKAHMNMTFIIPTWIILSSSVIIYNNYLYNTLNFKFPVFLVTWHLTFAVRFEFSSEREGRSAARVWHPLTRFRFA